MMARHSLKRRANLRESFCNQDLQAAAFWLDAPRALRMNQGSCDSVVGRSGGSRIQALLLSLGLHGSLLEEPSGKFSSAGGMDNRGPENAVRVNS